MYIIDEEKIKVNSIIKILVRLRLVTLKFYDDALILASWSLDLIICITIA